MVNQEACLCSSFKRAGSKRTDLRLSSYTARALRLWQSRQQYAQVGWWANSCEACPPAKKKKTNENTTSIDLLSDMRK